jgi:translation initiation factor IF-2
MAKKKVHDLAKEFNVSGAALVQMLRGMGIPVKSHMSTVDEELRTQIKEKFEQERADIKKEYERKKQILSKASEELETAALPRVRAEGRRRRGGAGSAGSARPAAAAKV